MQSTQDITVICSARCCSYKDNLSTLVLRATISHRRHDMGASVFKAMYSLQNRASEFITKKKQRVIIAVAIVEGKWKKLKSRKKGIYQKLEHSHLVRLIHMERV